MSAKWARLLAACRHSAAGLYAAYRDEEAFRQEVWLAAVLLPLAFWLDVGAVARAMMIMSVLLVLAAELLNTGLEAVVDLVSPEKSALAKKAKDTASAAVLLLLINAAVVWAVALLR